MSTTPDIPTLDAPQGARTRRLIAAAVLTSTTAIALSSLATQFIAWRLSYDDALGAPWLGGFYAPWSWIAWRAAPWADGEGNTFTVAAAICAALFVFIVLVAIQGSNILRRTPKGVDGLQGSARWIKSKQELQSVGFLPKDGATSEGVYIGARTDPKTKQVHYLRHDGPEHIGAIAPTRSGKGVGLVLPTMLSYPHSALVNDLKGELWEQTAGWRAKHANNVVIKFDPAAPTGSSSYNFLDEIRIESIHAIGDTQNIVAMIVDPEGKGLNDHWAKTAHALLTGLILHLLHKAWRARDEQPAGTTEVTEPVSLYNVAFELSDPSRSVNDLYEEMVQTAPYQPTPDAILATLDAKKQEAARDRDSRRQAQDGKRQEKLNERLARNAAKRDQGAPGYLADLESVLRDANAVIAAAGRDMLNKPDNERGSVLSTAMSFLTLYRDPVVRDNTTASDFRIHDLMNFETPVTVYLVVRPSDKDRLRPLVRLFLNQVVRNLTCDNLKRLDDGRFVSPHKRPLLLHHLSRLQSDDGRHGRPAHAAQGDTPPAGGRRRGGVFRGRVRREGQGQGDRHAVRPGLQALVRARRHGRQSRHQAVRRQAGGRRRSRRGEDIGRSARLARAGGPPQGTGASASPKGALAPAHPPAQHVPRYG